MRLAHRLIQVLHDEFDGAEIELREQVQIDVVEGEPRFGDNGAHERGPVIAVKGLWKFLDELHTRLAKLRERLWRRGAVRAARVDAERVVVLAAREQLAAEKPWRIARADDDHACAIRKERRRVFVVPVQELGHPVAARDENVAIVRVGRDIARRHIEPGHPRRARAVHIVRPRVRRAKFRLHDGRGRGANVVGRVGRDDDEIEIGWCDARAFNRLTRRGDDHIRCRFAFRHHVAFADAHIFNEPRVHVLAKYSIQVLVGDNFFWNVATGGYDSSVLNHVGARHSRKPS